MPHMTMTHDIDPAEDIMSRLGDLSELEVFHNDVIVATYIRPEKTKSGIYLTDAHRDEDRFQSKVGLLVKTGPDAFKPDADGGWWQHGGAELGQWLVHRPSDGWSVTINGVLCRWLKDTSTKGRIPHPDMVW